MTSKILLVDDHLVVLQGLRFFLETQEDMQVIGEAQNGEEALQKIEILQPDIVLTDLIMPKMDGIELTKKIKVEHPAVKVILLTSFSDQAYVLAGIKAGADGYQLKDVQPDILVQCVRAVLQGERQLHPQAAHQLMSHVADEDESQTYFESLTARERDVLYFITQGMSNKEIAEQLYVTEKTVKTHVTHILSKLDVQDRTQAAVHALKQKWFEDGPSV